jgi:hypothetical protein
MLLEHKGVIYGPADLAGFVEAVMSLTQDRMPPIKVDTDKDWKAIDLIITFYIDQYPEQWASFKADADLYRRSLKNEYGLISTDTKENYTNMRTTVQFPNDLVVQRLIKAVFPDQQFDRPFNQAFVRRYPAFAGGKI